MSPSHKRRALIIGILGLLFAVGAGCLTYLAVGAPETRSVGSGAEESPGAEPSGLASDDGDGAPPENSSAGGGDNGPPKPGRSINVNGVDLDGSGQIDCVVAINGFAKVTAKVTSVNVTGEVGISADPSGCATSDGAGCAGALLPPGEDCLVGVRLTGDEAAGPYSITVRLGLRATCTSARLVPCDQVADRSPSPANPIRISWTGSLSTTAELTGPEVTESPDTETPDTPETPESPDIQETPDTENTPESAPAESSS